MQDNKSRYMSTKFAPRGAREDAIGQVMSSLVVCISIVSKARRDCGNGGKLAREEPLNSGRPITNLDEPLLYNH